MTEDLSGKKLSYCLGFPAPPTAEGPHGCNVILTRRKRRLALTSARPESVQSQREVGHSPQCSIKWERDRPTQIHRPPRPLSNPQLLFSHFRCSAIRLSISVVSRSPPPPPPPPTPPLTHSHLSALRGNAEVTLNCSDAFRQLLRCHTLLSNMGSDRLTWSLEENK